MSILSEQTMTEMTFAKGRNWGSGVEHLKNSALGNSFIMHSILHLVVARIDGEFATPNNGAYRSLRGYHFFPQDDHGSGDRDRHGPPGYIYIYITQLHPSNPPLMSVSFVQL